MDDYSSFQFFLKPASFVWTVGLLRTKHLLRCLEQNVYCQLSSGSVRVCTCACVCQRRSLFKQSLNLASTLPIFIWETNELCWFKFLVSQINFHILFRLHCYLIIEIQCLKLGHFKCTQIRTVLIKSGSWQSQNRHSVLFWTCNTALGFVCLH